MTPTPEEKLVDMDGTDLINTPPSISQDHNDDESIVEDKDFVELAKQFDKSASRRETIISKLMTEFGKADLKFDQKGIDLTAKMAAVNTIAGLLKDQDTQAKDFVKLKLTKSEQDVNGASANLIARCLYELSGSLKDVKAGTTMIPKDADDQIEQLFKDKCKPILPGELMEHTKNEIA